MDIKVLIGIQGIFNKINKIAIILLIKHKRIIKFITLALGTPSGEIRMSILGTFGRIKMKIQVNKLKVLNFKKKIKNKLMI